MKIRYAARLQYSDLADKWTNNTTDYEALLLGLHKVKALGARNFLVKSNAKVIKEQIKKECEAREPELIKYLAEVRRMEKHFRDFTIEHLPRKGNGEVDDLAKKASRNEQLPLDVFFEVITTPSIKRDN